MLVAGDGRVCEALKRELTKLFPIDEWDGDSFDYIGSFIEIGEDGIKVSQSASVDSRFFEVDVPSYPPDEELDNRSLIGALLASQPVET